MVDIMDINSYEKEFFNDNKNCFESQNIFSDSSKPKHFGCENFIDGKNATSFGPLKCLVHAN